MTEYLKLRCGKDSLDKTSMDGIYSCWITIGMKVCKKESDKCKLTKDCFEEV